MSGDQDRELAADARGAPVPRPRAGGRGRAGRRARVLRGRAGGGARAPAGGLRPGRARPGAAPPRRRLDARHRARGRARRAAPARAAPHAAPDAGAGRDAGDRRLPAARVAPRGDADPRRQRGLGGGHAARPGAGRGGGPLDLRRGPVPDDAAVPQALRPRLAGRPPRPRGVGPDARGGGRPARAPAAGRRGARGRGPRARRRRPARARLRGRGRGSRSRARARCRRWSAPSATRCSSASRTWSPRPSRMRRR